MAQAAFTRAPPGGGPHSREKQGMVLLGKVIPQTTNYNCKVPKPNGLMAKGPAHKAASELT